MPFCPGTFPRSRKLWSGAWLLAGLAGCVEPYAPDVISSPTTSYLVVDGFLNARGRTRIRLSRTAVLAADNATPLETGASLTIEGQQDGARYLLREIAPGTYVSDSLQLDKTRQYRLHIMARQEQEYASAFVPVLLTPPIDSVRWRNENDQAINISLDAHDETGQARYFRWQGTETWEIVPLHVPIIEYFDNKIQPIRVRYPRVCWTGQQVSPIRLADLTALSSSVVRDQLFHSLPILSKPLFSRYSLLVQQYAISQEEYQYWTTLKKNTESLGTLFDPQPVQLTGNVQCLTDPTEPVLGYVGAHSQTEKRIFISRSELPNSLRIASEYDGRCARLDTLPVYEKYRFSSPGIVPVGIIVGAFGISGYTWSIPTCIDCRRRGTDVRPSYWPKESF